MTNARPLRMRKVQCAVVLLAVSACGDETAASEPLVLGDLDAEADGADTEDAAFDDIDDVEIEALDLGAPDAGVEVIGPDGSVQVVFPDLTPPTVDGLPADDSDAGEGGRALPNSVSISNTNEFPPGAGIGATGGTQTGGTQTGNGINPPSVGGPNAASEAFPPGAGIGATTGTSTGSGTNPPSVGGPNTASEAFPPGAGIGASTGTSTGDGTSPPSVRAPNTAGEVFPNAF